MADKQDSDTPKADNNQADKSSAEKWEATLFIGGFVKQLWIYELLPELQIVAPSELKMEYRTEARKQELETLDVPKRWRFRLKWRNDKLKRAGYEFYSQE